MKALLGLLAVLYAGAAMAQSSPPPTVGDKPLVQVKPRGAAKQPKAAPGKPKSIAGRLQECLEIEDGSKGRLDCYDVVIKPQPKAKPPAAKGVMDCKFVKEEDERLNCFNGFVERLPKIST